MALTSAAGPLMWVGSGSLVQIGYTFHVMNDWLVLAVYLPAEAAKGGEEKQARALPNKVLLVTSDDRLASDVSAMLQQLGCRVTVISEPTTAPSQQVPQQADVVLYSGHGDDLPARLLASRIVADREQVIEILSLSQREDAEKSQSLLTHPFGLEELRRCLLAARRAAVSGVDTAA